MEAFRQQRSSDSVNVDVDIPLDTLHSSIEMFSPTSPIFCIQPRKLKFADDEVSQEKYSSPRTKQIEPKSIEFISPPYRKVRALRLFDTPATPKTILQKSSGLNHLSMSVSEHSDLLKTAERPRSIPLHNRALENVISDHTANVNPFTPDSLMAHNKKRCRTHFGNENLNTKSVQIILNADESKLLNEKEQLCDLHQAPKRLALQDTNISRFKKEFVQISLIGVGEFGLVYQCLNRLDGCIYAIKKSIKPVAGSSFEKRALNEVWAHAVLGKHDNVVRYYSAWAEDNHMLIQNEFCNGGSLQSLIQKRFLNESELKILLLHIAEGLRYIHSNDLVHMDLKSGNIFLTKDVSANKPPVHKENCEDVIDGMEGIYEELYNSECIITYKIGDLGHVTSVKEPNVEEGDCRYLPNEILQEDFSNLFKADIFSLGLTLFEAAGGGPLPKNGPQWHNLRNGKIPYLSSLSREFNDLIRQMTDPKPQNRPSSTSIFNHPILSSLESKSKSQLTQELAIEKRKNEILLRKLREAKKNLKIYEQQVKSSHTPCLKKRCLRSNTRRKSLPHVYPKLQELRDRNKNVIQYNDNTTH